MKYLILNQISSLLFICTIFLTVSSCSNNKSNISGNDDNLQSVILPLNKGNIWSFEVIKYNSFGLHLDKYDAYNTITSDTTISKEK